MADSQDNSTGILGAVSSVAQQATSVVSNALEAMHITAPQDQENETQDVNGKSEVDQEDKKDAAELEEGEIRETNGKEEKQGPKTVFDDPASFNLKVSSALFSLDVSSCVAETLSTVILSPPMLTSPSLFSTHCTPHGHCISARQMSRTCPKRQLHQQLVAALSKRPQTGWRTSERSSPLTRLRNSGGETRQIGPELRTGV